MRIHRFTGETTADAVQRLRETLGDDVLVLSTQPDPEGGVVIVAATEADLDEPEPLGWAPAAELTALGVEDELRSELALIRLHLEQLGRKVHRMDRVLLELDGGGAKLGPEAREVADRLVASGLGRHVAEPIGRAFEREIEASRPREAALAAGLLGELRVAPPPATRVTALVGPTGGGKTTTIAKIAARRVTAGEPAPGLIVADGHRVGAFEQLASYAALLGAPVRAARDGGELRRALDELAACDRIYVDTAGLCGDPAVAAELHGLLGECGEQAGVVAVISATAALSSLQRMWPQLARLRPLGCAVTRLDEADEPGIPLTWLAEAGLPLVWLGTGRRVPDDLAAASAGELIRRLMAA
jgi:flagellar biosynthesis protein FlhF